LASMPLEKLDSMTLKEIHASIQAQVWTP
jgi:hypothetical protein